MSALSAIETPVAERRLAVRLRRISGAASGCFRQWLTRSDPSRQRPLRRTAAMASRALVRFRWVAGRPAPGPADTGAQPDCSTGAVRARSVRRSPVASAGGRAPGCGGPRRPPRRAPRQGAAGSNSHGPRPRPRRPRQRCPAVGRGGTCDDGVGACPAAADQAGPISWHSCPARRRDSGGAADHSAGLRRCAGDESRPGQGRLPGHAPDRRAARTDPVVHRGGG